MGRLASVRRLAVGPIVLTAALAGCSSGHKGATPPTTTTTAAGSVPTTTTGPSTTTTTAPSSTSSTVPPTTTAPTTPPPTAGSGAAPAITSYTVSPARPVCNTPTQVQLEWTAANALTVDLAIDGQFFASYGGGAQTHLEYFACDGHPHAYTLTAHAGSRTATATKVVTSLTAPT